jgi:glutathione S-transferase
VITLYTFGRYFGLPDPSPFVMKGEMLLKLAGLAYQTNTRGYSRAPKGKLPYIDDDGVIVADSTLIRLHLARKHGIDFDRGLSSHQRGVAWAIEKMLEDHLYWALIYWRWLDDANFARGPRDFFQRAPAVVRPFAIWAVRRSVRQKLRAHGLGRHSEAELTELGIRAIEALAQILGDHRYLLGQAPCGADATAFAFVASTLARTFTSPLQAKAQSLPNLVAYHERMMAEFYPGFAAHP